MRTNFLVVFSLCIAVSILEATATLGRLPRRRLIFRDEHGHPNKYRHANAPYYRRRLQDTEIAKASNFDTATTTTSAEAARVSAGAAERTTTKAVTFASPAVLASATTTETTTIRDGGNYGFGKGDSPFGGNYGYAFYPDDYSLNGGGYGYPGNDYPGNFGFGFPGNFGYESATGANTATESIDATKTTETQASNVDVNKS